ncbi:hypothetical protein Psed_3587 [Pseudonocardia dioxanivorans CB1190]|uniref:Tryptophan 2,3-dioxygenase n=1 Tax=Pseudonocardia dioxanivorans (strain ATCC 55486 / DSM 44775 / JCM 13855 / CB1190) TaxID=675635 RepID=F4D0A3_PSEUX|nr:tryptophan 2,3-dioxygenase family protein [Pseudonocardia dioxanivorans]AEA25759.1 hypothetical protein Psed_3587 [Pseudonocardia dioxanivorans CB1190]
MDAFTSGDPLPGPATHVAVPMVPRGAALDAPAIATAVAAQVRRTGTHALPVAMLVRLGELRRRHGAGHPFLDAYLGCVLARHECRFSNRTYLALPLLERVRAAAGLAPDRLAALLMADVVRVERSAAGPDLPDPPTRRKRIRHALRFVAASDDHPVTADDQLDAVALPELPATGLATWFGLSVLPVSTRHDEYFFIRALQTREMIFTTLADEMVAATAALRAGRTEQAIARVERADRVFARAAMLFRLVATLRVDAFLDFREHTEGASAIQSEQYKRFEVVCGRPSGTRLGSAAFAGVPRVRSAVEAGVDTLSDARREADAALGAVGRAALDRALGRLEAGHQRWKAAHHGLAVRMLGDAPGSGYTAGAPYLRACLSNRLFGGLAAS